MSKLKLFSLTLCVIFIVSLNQGTQIIFAGIAQNQLDNKVLVLTDKGQYKKGELVKITIKNNSGQRAIVFAPVYIIEKLEDNSWGRVKQVDCRCGWKCKQKLYEEFLPQTIKEFQWDQKEEWCANDPLDRERMISMQVALGTYRIRGSFSMVDGTDFLDSEAIKNLSKTIVYSKEFGIEQ